MNSSAGDVELEGNDAEVKLVRNFSLRTNAAALGVRRAGLTRSLMMSGRRRTRRGWRAMGLT